MKSRSRDISRHYRSRYYQRSSIRKNTNELKTPSRRKTADLNLGNRFIMADTKHEDLERENSPALTEYESSGSEDSLSLSGHSNLPQPLEQTHNETITALRWSHTHTSEIKVLELSSSKERDKLEQKRRIENIPIDNDLSVKIIDPEVKRTAMSCETPIFSFESEDDEKDEKTCASTPTENIKTINPHQIGLGLDQKQTIKIKLI
eukprot:UN32760